MIKVDVVKHWMSIPMNDLLFDITMTMHLIIILSHLTTSLKGLSMNIAFELVDESGYPGKVKEIILSGISVRSCSMRYNMMGLCC